MQSDITDFFRTVPLFATILITLFPLCISIAASLSARKIHRENGIGFTVTWLVLMAMGFGFLTIAIIVGAIAARQ